MDTKSLSSRQVRWAQELSRYHFRIDYRQGKANAAADALSRFPQRSQSEEEELRAENTQILHRLQSSLTNASLLSLSLSDQDIGSQTKAANLSLRHKVLICDIYVLPWLCQIWEKLRRELASEGPDEQVSIGDLRLGLPKLQEEDQAATKIRQPGLKEGRTEFEGLLHYQSLLYLPEIIITEIISRYHNNPLEGHFGIEKI